MQQQQTNKNNNKQKEKHEHKKMMFDSNFGHLYFRSCLFSETMRDRGMSSTY